MKTTTVTGIVKRHPDGFGFLVPDDSEIPDLYLARKEMRGVMANDRVEADLQKERGGDRFFGINVKVLERGISKVVGTLRQQADGDMNLIESFDKYGAALTVPRKETAGAKEGELVAVEITSYPSQDHDFIGRVIEVIGDEADPLNDLKRVLHLQNIPMDFQKETLDEAAQIPDVVTKQDIKGRKDLRDLAFITIDGVTAKDFDDAIFVESLGGKGFRLRVAIADVSHYVRVGRPIDKDAVERGTSVYLPNFVVPMLPESLSNEMCSLKPHVDRLAFVCEMEIGFDGQVTHKELYEAVIQSHKRVTYGQAQDFINGDGKFEDSKVEENITLASDLAKILMAKRFREGSLDLEVPETEVIVNELGEPEDIIKSERVFAHRLIEELMLAANVSVAQWINSHDEEPCLYRIHEPPDAEDVAKIQGFLSGFGSKTRLGGGHLQKKLTKALQEFKGQSEGIVLNILTLRSMSQAKYSSNNIGHFGLGFSDYAHFTSPIRRYPDLIVHRIAKGLLKTSKSGFLYSDDELATKGTILSACEQRAVKAERMVISIKKSRFMENKVGETYTGIISSVAKFGIFVLLRQYDVDGLVKTESLGNDHFEFDEDRLLLQGKRSRKVFKIGDKVEVLVAAVDTEQGRIDFILTGESKATGESRERKKAPPPKRKSKKKAHRGSDSVAARKKKSRKSQSSGGKPGDEPGSRKKASKKKKGKKANYQDEKEKPDFKRKKSSSKKKKKSKKANARGRARDNERSKEKVEATLEPAAKSRFNPFGLFSKKKKKPSEKSSDAKSGGKLQLKSSHRGLGGKKKSGKKK